MGCAAPRAPVPVPEPETQAVPLPATRVTSNDGTYVVAYDARPAPIPTNAEFALDVAVLDARGTAAVPDAALRVDATMPDHGHGMNVVPRTTPTGDGRFRVEGLLFHMNGYWELSFDVTRGAVTERAQVGIEID
jgi:hypothetical protein